MRFPLGDYKKSEIRQLATEYKLSVRDKPDSQDICFVTSDSYRDLVNNLNPSVNKKGIIYDVDNNILGTHDGISNYTIGQRKGIGISGSKEPLYVTDINKEQISITLGTKEKLRKNVINFKNINWLGGNIPVSYTHLTLPTNREV